MEPTCLIIYSSMTGNTKEMAMEIGKGIREVGVRVEIKDILYADVADLLEYNGVLLGAHTWGDGELPDEFLDFYEEMGDLDLNEMVAASFGSCDSAYEHRGRAVDLLTEKLGEIGAMVANNGLKIDLAPTTDEREQCVNFGREFAMTLIQKHASC